MATIFTKNHFGLLIILALFQYVSPLQAQDTTNTPTQFPTIKNDPNIDLDNPNQEKNTQIKIKNRRRNPLSAEGAVQTRSHFYGDIITGGLIFIIGIAGYFIFQKVKKRRDNTEQSEVD